MSARCLFFLTIAELRDLFFVVYALHCKKDFRNGVSEFAMSSIAFFLGVYYALYNFELISFERIDLFRSIAFFLVVNYVLYNFEFISFERIEFFRILPRCHV